MTATGCHTVRCTPQFNICRAPNLLLLGVVRGITRVKLACVNDEACLLKIKKKILNYNAKSALIKANY